MSGAFVPTRRWRCGCPVGRPEIECRLPEHRLSASLRAELATLVPTRKGRLRSSIVVRR